MLRSILSPTRCTPGIIPKDYRRRPGPLAQSCSVLLLPSPSVPFCLRPGSPTALVLAFPPSAVCRWPLGWLWKDPGVCGRRGVACDLWGGRRSSSPAVPPQHVEFRKQQDLDNILEWKPSEVSPRRVPQATAAPSIHPPRPAARGSGDLAWWAASSRALTPCPGGPAVRRRRPVRLRLRGLPRVVRHHRDHGPQGPPPVSL